MDAELKQLAEVGLALTAAEGALEQSAFTQAAEALDRAADGLAELRAQWLALGPARRALIGKAAAPLRARCDRAKQRLPARTAVSGVPPECDPDEEVNPAAPEAA